MIEENFSEFGCCGCLVAGNEVAHLREAINNNEDGIVPL